MYYSISVSLSLLEVHKEATRLGVIAKRQECSSTLQGEIGRYDTHLSQPLPVTVVFWFYFKFYSFYSLYLCQCTYSM